MFRYRLMRPMKIHWKTRVPIRNPMSIRIFPIFPRRLSVNFFEQILEIIAVVEAVFQSYIRDGTVGGKMRRLGVFEPYIV